MRRAAREGLVHGERLSARRFRTSVRERSYLRRHWGFLSALREALRTEPNVRLAVLFGSMATGREHAGSDVDVLVALRDDRVARLADLSGRLSRRLRRNVQVVRLAEAERSPLLMADLLGQGRVLVDRDGTWASLKAREGEIQRRAAREEPRLDDVPELELRGLLTGSRR